MDASISSSYVQTNAVTWFAIQAEIEPGMFPGDEPIIVSLENLIPQDHFYRHTVRSSRCVPTLTGRVVRREAQDEWFGVYLFGPPW